MALPSKRGVDLRAPPSGVVTSVGAQSMGNGILQVQGLNLWEIRCFCFDPLKLCPETTSLGRPILSSGGQAGHTQEEPRPTPLPGGVSPAQELADQVAELDI